MNYEKMISSIYVIVTVTADSISVPAGTIIRITDIRDPKTVIGTVYGFDSSVTNTVELQTKVNKMVGNPVKLPSIAVQLYPSNAMNGNGCLERYCLPVDFYSQIQGKILINKKNDCYYISPQIIQLLEIDPEMIKETRLKFIHGQKSLYICETYSDSDNLNHVSFTIEESGAFKISKEDSKALEEMFKEYFGTNEVDEIVISKLPNVVKSDRLSFGQGFKLSLERNLTKGTYMTKGMQEELESQFRNRDVVTINVDDPNTSRFDVTEFPEIEEEQLDAQTEELISNLSRTSPEAAAAIRRSHVERQRNIRTRNANEQQLRRTIFGNESITQA